LSPGAAQIVGMVVGEIQMGEARFHQARRE
jgi:hypothetical protein